MDITLSSATTRRALFATTALIMAAGFAAEALREAYRLPKRYGFVPMFSLSYEQNVPTWYSSALLFACSLLLAVIARGTQRAKAHDVGRWGLLAAAFLYISIDETASIHEGASRFFDFDGVLYFGWVIPAGAVVLALGLAYVKFLLRLPKRTRNQFIVAGAIYVTGALLFELPLGYWTDRHGSDNVGYAAIDWVEESLELLGVNLFLLSLLDYLGAQGIVVAFAPTPAGEEAAAGAPPREP
jgi:hypothetical protein